MHTPARIPLELLTAAHTLVTKKEGGNNKEAEKREKTERCKRKRRKRMKRRMGSDTPA